MCLGYYVCWLTKYHANVSFFFLKIAQQVRHLVSTSSHSKASANHKQLVRAKHPPHRSLMSSMRVDEDTLPLCSEDTYFLSWAMVTCHFPTNQRCKRLKVFLQSPKYGLKSILTLLLSSNKVTMVRQAQLGTCAWALMAKSFWLAKGKRMEILTWGHECDFPWGCTWEKLNTQTLSKVLISHSYKGSQGCEARDSKLWIKKER